MDFRVLLQIGDVAFERLLSLLAEEIDLDLALHVARAHVTAPLVAIGGMTVERVPAVLAAGADGIAVISAIGMARDPGAAAAAFLLAIRDARRLDTSRAFT